MAYAKIDQALIAKGKACRASFGVQCSQNWRAYSGMVMAFAGSSVPAGWLDCNGAAVSRTTYGRLFAAIGTTWGAGDGSTTFNLPDFRGRALLGAGTGSGLTARALAATGGAETATLDDTTMPSHTHDQSYYSTGSTTGLALTRDSAPSTNWTNTDATGTGSAHQNMQPYKALYWLIKA